MREKRNAIDKNTFNFRGQYTANLTDDGRICLCKRVREQFERRGLGKAVIGIIPGRKAIAIMPESMMKAWLGMLLKGIPKREPEMYKRFVASSYSVVTWDRKGRFFLPDACMRHLIDKEKKRIDGSLLFVGVDSRFELWVLREFEKSKDAFTGGEEA